MSLLLLIIGIVFLVIGVVALVAMGLYGFAFYIPVFLIGVLLLVIYRKIKK